MKKTSLFLSVAWLAMAAVSLETHAGAVATQAPANSGLGAKFKGFFKKKQAAPVITSSSAVGTDSESVSPSTGAGAGEGVGVEPPAAAAPALKRSSSGLGNLFGRGRANSAPATAGAVVAPLDQAPMAPKAAEAEDAYDMSKTIATLEGTDAQKISEFKSLLSKVGKNRLGSAFSSSKKCRTWGGYRAELVAGRDFYGSNCAKEFCSQYCAPVAAVKFWAENTLGETVCAFRCARGVSMGDSNARLKAAYDGTKDRNVWKDALNHWKELEGASVVTADNLVNANAADAVRSAKAIAAYKGAVKAAAKSTSPAEVRAGKELGAAGVAMTEAYVKFKLAADDIQNKAQALDATIQKTEAAIKAAENQGFDNNRISATISAALKSGKVSLQQYGRLFKGQLEFVNALDSVRARNTIAHDRLLETVKQYEGAYAQLKAVLEKKDSTEGDDKSVAGMATPASPVGASDSLSAAASAAATVATASTVPTEIEAGLQAIVDEDKKGNDRGDARRVFISQHKDKVALKRALLALEVQNDPLGKEATAMLRRAELRDVVVQ